MEQIESAILRTLLYADIFSFAMSIEELDRHLISPIPIDLRQIQNCINTSPRLKKILIQDQKYITLKNRAENIALRHKRERYIEFMWEDAIRYGHWLSKIPFVRMVALTGALAVRNPANENDDYDYLLVTEPGRVWLARAFAIVLVRIIRFRKRELCPNYVLASNQLFQNRQDLFMAREIVQMFPIYGGTIYERMMRENQWTTTYLANGNPHPTGQDAQSRFKNVLERLLGDGLGDKLEDWEYKRKRRKFEPETHRPEASAVIDRNHVKGHFKDNGNPVMQQYQKRLQEYGLLDDSIQELAGD